MNRDSAGHWAAGVGLASLLILGASASGAAGGERPSIGRAIIARPADASPVPTSGTVWAWGWNRDGQLGDGTFDESDGPTHTLALSNVVSVSTGGTGSGHSLALTGDGTAWGWGDNTAGQVGVTGFNTSATPVPITSLGPTHTVGLAAGNFHSLAVLADGSVWAWGLNNFGQIGPGPAPGGRSFTPIRVDGVADAISVAGGTDYSLALTGDGSVWAWGADDHGQLGNGTTTGAAANPTPVQVHLPLTATVTAIAAGDQHALALASDGTVWGWGDGSNGELGTGGLSSVANAMPLQIADPVDAAKPFTGVVAIAAGSGYSLAIKADGTVWAWGKDDRGQIGLTSGTSSASPQQMPVLHDVTAISAGQNHAVVREADSSVWSWGDNSTGELGLGTHDMQAHAVPARVLHLGLALAVSAGEQGTLAIVATPTPPAATSTATAIPSSMGTATSTDTATATPTATATSTATNTPTTSATATSTATNSATTTSGTTATATTPATAATTGTPTVGPTASATRVPTGTNTATDTPTATSSPPATPTGTAAASATPTATDTPIVCTADSGPHVFVRYGHAYGRRAIVGGQPLPVTVRADPGSAATLTVRLFDAPMRGGRPLFDTSVSGTIGADGRMTAPVPIRYAPSGAVPGVTLVVGARTACGTDRQRLAVVMLPLRHGAAG